MTARWGRLLLTVGCSLVGVSICVVARGQQSDPPIKAKSGQPAVNSPVEPPGSGESVGRPGRRGGKGRRIVRFSELAVRRVLLLNKLEKTVLQKLQLDDKQTVAVKRVFQEYISEVNATVTALTKPGKDRRRRPANMNELLELQAKMTEARKAGDIQTADRLRDRIVYGETSGPKRSDLALQLMSTPTAFFQNLAAELPSSQHGQFNRLAQRWWALYPQIALEYPLGRLYRASLDPELDISNGQREAIRKMIAEASADLKPVGSDEVLVRKWKKETLFNILKSLTPAQRLHYQTTLDELEADGETERIAREKIRASFPAVPARGTRDK